jgi:hypothetical protein
MDEIYLYLLKIAPTNLAMLLKFVVICDKYNIVFRAVLHSNYLLTWTIIVIIIFNYDDSLRVSLYRLKYLSSWYLYTIKWVFVCL